EEVLETAVKQDEKRLNEAIAAEKELEPLMPDVNRFADARRRLKALDSAKKSYDESLRVAEGVRKDRELLDKKLPRAAQFAKNEADLKACEEVLKKAEAEAAEADKALKEARTEFDTRQAEANTKIKSLQSEINSARKKMNEIITAGRDGICPTCERPLGDEYEKVVADFEAQIKDKSESVESLRNEDYGEVAEKIKAADRYKSAKDNALREAADAVTFARGEVKIGKEYVEDCDKLKASIAKSEASVKALAGDFNPAEYDEAEKTTEELQELYDRAKNLHYKADEKAKSERKFKETLTNLEEIKTKRAGIAKALKDLNFDAEAYEKLTAEHKALSEDVHAAEVAFERAKGDVKAFEVAYKSALDKEKELKENAAKLAEARKESLYLDELRTRFDRFRDDLNSRARPELEDHAAEYLKMMTGERYDTVELDEYYNAVIRYDGEPLPVISGGESDVLNLSLRLGISQMITDRAGHSFSLLVLDEIFGSLDDERKANVVDVLRHLRTRFEQIIIITHVDLVRDAVDCGIQVTFDRESGTSSLKEA
ncbi:MAG: hypothetical protein J6X53_10330, partial [Abditibacteriota bacterium]|nr:hypothetical protein [Abditibacteriota bacterium]